MSIGSLSAVRAICEHTDWDVSNLHIQKILYIAHKIFVGKKSPDERNLRLLINKDFYAWDYGPVVPSVYRTLKMFGADNVEPFSKLFNAREPDEEKEEYRYIKEVCGILSNVSPSRLVAITHRRGGAWEKNYERGGKDILIPHEDIYREYWDDREKDAS